MNLATARASAREHFIYLVKPASRWPQVRSDLAINAIYILQLFSRCVSDHM